MTQTAVPTTDDDDDSVPMAELVIEEKDAGFSGDIEKGAIAAVDDENDSDSDVISSDDDK